DPRRSEFLHRRLPASHGDRQRRSPLPRRWDRAQFLPCRSAATTACIGIAAGRLPYCAMASEAATQLKQGRPARTLADRFSLPEEPPMTRDVLKFVLFALVLSLFAADRAAQAGSVRVYVTNSAGDNVHVVDPATNQVVQVF